MNKTTIHRLKALLPNGNPKYVRVYDDGGNCDRYTVVYTGHYRGKGENFQYVGMNAAPYHPQGICQHGESPTQIDVNGSGFAPAMGRKNHLGKRIPFSELPPDCQRLVMQNYRAIWKLPSALEMLKLKLHPARFSDMSPKMAAIVGCIVGENWVTPALGHLSITSDGFVVSGSHFIGSKEDLLHNWTNLLKAADLSADERHAAEHAFATNVTQF